MQLDISTVPERRPRLRGSCRSNGAWEHRGATFFPYFLLAAFNIGDIVRLKDSVRTYYPEGPAISAVAKTGDPHKITQKLSNGAPVVKGGARCVLLGARVNLATGKESAGVNTWAAEDFLELVPVAAAQTTAAVSA